jgi:lipopolysaccharide transport system ATP-binding protein
MGNAEELSKVYLAQLYAGQPEPEDREAVTSGAASTLNIQTPGNRTRTLEGDMQKETRYLVSAFRPNAERFGHGGATIKDAGFLDEDGQSTLSIRGGQRVQFYIRADIHATVRWPAFGFMIKNSLGEFVFTEGTDAHFRSHELVFKPGDVVTSYFLFAMPHMNRGKYLINVAFAEGLGDDHAQHCWMHDAIAIDAIESRLAHGYCGMTDISMKIEISERGPQ